MECKTCCGEGGLIVDNFGDVQSFECPDCKGTGVGDLIQEVKEIIETKQLLFQYDKELHLLIGLVDRLEIAERQRDEAVEALGKYAKEKNWGADNHGCSKIFHECDYEGYELAAETLKRIKGDSQAEGHQSTESPSVAAAETGIGGSYE
ncbi:hypothetical protein BK125_04660 [Paenibacillus odorifer]|uniref:Transcription factor zinc-finger domain-containing protein n=1 Tax=Paenibacillus odorifer TaxID=189426 RepID=A0ABX3GLS9_9BACL|nr:hypothetical protein [Paenibacillus odorifer]OMC79575.1 hypothetical protein BK125_04660 [Paenibacillus odorifer]OMD30781.1 hypothetical protein BSO21_17900 [Paenibacillus odorifer]